MDSHTNAISAMDYDHIVYVLVTIGIALENAAFTKVLEKAIGSYGITKLHEVEMVLAREKNLKPYMP